MAKEYIERNALIAEYDRVHVGPPGGARKLMVDAPAANVAEVKHSRIRWINRPIPAQYATIEKENGEKHYGKVHDLIENNPVGYCEECGKRLDDTFMNFCPNCGTKLDGGKAE